MTTEPDASCLVDDRLRFICAALDEERGDVLLDFLEHGRRRRDKDVDMLLEGWTPPSLDEPDDHSREERLDVAALPSATRPSGFVDPSGLAPEAVHEADVASVRKAIARIGVRVREDGSSGVAACWRYGAIVICVDRASQPLLALLHGLAHVALKHDMEERDDQAEIEAEAAAYLAARELGYQARGAVDWLSGRAIGFEALRCSLDRVEAAVDQVLAVIHTDEHADKRTPLRPPRPLSPTMDPEMCLHW